MDKERKWESTLPIREEKNAQVQTTGEKQPMTGWPLLQINSRDGFKKDKAQDAHLRMSLKFTLHSSLGVEKPQLK